MRHCRWRWWRHCWCGGTQRQRRQCVLQNVCRLTIGPGWGGDGLHRRHGSSRCDGRCRHIRCCQSVGRCGKRLCRDEAPISCAIMLGFKHSAGIMARRKRHRGRRYSFRLSGDSRGGFRRCGYCYVLGLIRPCRQWKCRRYFLPALVHLGQRCNRNHSCGGHRQRIGGVSWCRYRFRQCRFGIRFDLERRHNLRLHQNRRNRSSGSNGLHDGGRRKHCRRRGRRDNRFHRCCRFRHHHTRFRNGRRGSSWSRRLFGSVGSRVNQRSRVNPSVASGRGNVARATEFSRLPNPILSGDKLVQSQSVGDIGNVVRGPIGDLIKRADV